MIKTTPIVTFSAALLLNACATTTVAPGSFEAGGDVLAERIAYQPVKTPAKNVILFIGDGMGVSTVTAARIFEGQQRKNQGEEHNIFRETF